ncbi:helix-turn-helix domain-containing protein [Paenibacillus crassostreae]|uniref:AraC family transcriptional regulator n=1 Tax=Paenibacillus crassostreae TaxID=1763538 RepID=A0A167FA48_9BACL|nr:helix-turn-helix domain-containing protein [Paenibacillus crassostreae]AOZ90890.1 AraC family transcriptional regulator [Paenibacillus crassostreae]OAB76343.1 AraC family transcriptional regulator [Paenibacillus crassostreae]
MSNVYLNLFTRDEHFPFFIQYGSHEENTTFHNHVDFSELVIVLNGHATHIVNSEESFIKKGNVFVINSGTSHAYKDPYDFKICNIMYKPEMLNSAGSDLRTLNGFQALFILEPFYRSINPYKSKLNISIVSLEYVASLISIMIKEYEEKIHGYKTMLASRFMELVVYLSRQYDHQEKGIDASLMHLANAISYIEDHYLVQVTLEEIATKSDISVRHLNRLFRAYYLTTPIAYLQRLRLERACTLLNQTNLSITEISYECGFNDSNYLTRQFKKTYGMSPKSFRNKK